MILVQINSCNFGSTGNIMLGIDKIAINNGIETYICVPKSRENSKKNIKNQIMIGNRISRNLHLFLANITGFQGCFSFFSTWNFLRKLSRIKPDIIHLHNLHNSYINIPMLFRYIKKHDIYVVWTLHDCWSFTGQCPHFIMAKCDKWKDGCYCCSQYRNYPSSKVDRTKTMWKLKKKWFSDIKHIMIVTPSQWLASLVKESYFKDYPIKVINNGINLEIFKPMESDFRKKNKLEDIYIIIGVANPWSERKGLDVFIELSKRLNNNYKIVLVGTNEKLDKKIPDNIISIHRTNTQAEIAEIYSAADIFVNPTREENYPTVNMESLACGTPVITFETGGSPEIIDKMCGCVVSCDDINTLEKKIIEITSRELYSFKDCLKRSKHFNENDKYNEYLNVYGGIKNEQNKENHIKK